MVATPGARSNIALLGHEADIIVTDWFWVMRQRSLGGDYLFMPYSAALGGVIVPGDSPIKSVADLKGKKIGVAGGPIDKSWLLLRAYAIKSGAGDLVAAATPVFAAPPLLNEQAAAGRIDAAPQLLAFCGEARVHRLSPNDRGFSNDDVAWHREPASARRHVFAAALRVTIVVCCKTSPGLFKKGDDPCNVG